MRSRWEELRRCSLARLSFANKVRSLNLALGATQMNNETNEPARANVVRLPLTGFFKDPFWFRCLVSILVFLPGFVILGFCVFIAHEGELLHIVICLFTVEPLAAYLVLTGLALIAPKAFGRWYLSSRKTAFMIIIFWCLAVAIVLLAVFAFHVSPPSL